MRDSLTLGRIAGIRFGVNWSWAIVFALIVWTLATGIFPSTNRARATTPTWRWRSSPCCCSLPPCSCTSSATRPGATKEGMEIEGITLWIFGGIARFKGTFPSAGAEFRIAIAGPIVTLVIGAAALTAALLVQKTQLPGVWDGVVFPRARLREPGPAGLQPGAGSAPGWRARTAVRTRARKLHFPSPPHVAPPPHSGAVSVSC